MTVRILDLLAEIFTPAARHAVEERDSRETLRQQVDSGAGSLGVDLDENIVVFRPRGPDAGPTEVDEER